jgi:excisionase family DNA binding protein
MAIKEVEMSDRKCKKDIPNITNDAEFVCENTQAIEDKSRSSVDGDTSGNIAKVNKAKGDSVRFVSSQFGQQQILAISASLPLYLPTIVKEVIDTLDIKGRIDDLIECYLINSTEWLTSYEASKYLGISSSQLTNKASNGLVPHYKFGNLNRYKKSELNELLGQKQRGGITHGN